MATTTASAASGSASAIYESLNGKKETKSSDSIDAAQNRFLMLLTTQLKNQDPLNPMDNAQVTSQLAQISTVDGIERLNTTLSKLIDGQNQSQTMQAAALVGHSVLVAGSGMDLIDGGAVAGVTLSGPADDVKVEIKDANGLVVRTLSLGAQEAGVHGFAWDGKSDSGAQAVDGRYTFAATAKQGGEPVTIDGLELGAVDSVSNGSQGITVSVGRLGMFGVNEIKQIF